VNRQQKRRVYLIMGAVAIVLFAIGVAAGYRGRGNPLCKDGKPPLAQQDTGIGQIAYKCHNGQIVIK
jgi:hypothetical protein